MKRNRNFLKKFYCVSYDNLSETKEYLENMAQAGWMFQNFDGMIMRFKKCEPKKLNFAVEIFDKTSAFATCCNEQNMEYIEYCEAAGWNYISSHTFLQFFYSEDMDLTPIETDEKMKLENIWKSTRYERINKGILMPVIGLLFIYQRIQQPVLTLSGYDSFSVLILWMMLILCNVTMLCLDFRWYFVSKNKVQEGEKILKRKHLPLFASYLLLAVLLTTWAGIGIFVYLNTGDMENLMISCIILFILVFMIVYYKVDSMIVKAKVSPRAHLGSVIISSVLVVLVLSMTSIIWCNVIDDGHRKYTIAKSDGWEERYADDIPYYFDNKGNLIKQPKSIKKRKKSNYETSHDKNGKFIIQSDDYEQYPINEKRSDIEVQYCICKSSSDQMLEYLVEIAGKKRHDYTWNYVDINVKNMVYQKEDICIYQNFRKSDEVYKYHYLIRKKGAVINLQSSKEIADSSLKIMANE